MTTFPQIEITFSPAWWLDRYGMPSTPEVWQDPFLAVQRDQEQRRLLFERFGDVGLGEADPAPRPTAGGEWGHRFMAAFWGCEIVYPADGVPSEVSLPDAAERMRHLRLPDVDSSPVARRALENARRLRLRYGKCESAINFGGPLNNAVSVLGGEFLAACAAEPELARDVLRKMGQAVLLVHDRVACRIRGVEPSAARAGNWGIGNCPVCMISPGAYRRVVLPVDLWFRGQFAGDFHLHHCGVFDAYAEVYRPLAPDELDLGPGSSLRLARRAYPRARISTYFAVETLAEMSRAEIDRLLAEMIQEAAPAELFTWVRAIEIGPQVSDDTVRDLMTAQARYQF